MSLEAIRAVRYSGDVQDEESLRSDPDLAPAIEEHSRGTQSLSQFARREELANAVRIDRQVLPELDQAIDALTSRLQMDERIECYVFSYPEIQAYVARSGDRFIVGLASAAIEKLQPQELEYVIGHEIGHVIYGHVDFPMGQLLGSYQSRRDPRIQPKHAIRLFTWNRKKEISADRAGLVACGSLDAAASAIFKTASGLSLPDLKVNPLRLASQFDDLQQEMLRLGSEDMWMLTHPLLPLRMKSLRLFWRTDKLQGILPEAPGGLTEESCDRDVGELLAHMDPLSHRSDSGVDPMLKPFLTWGGLYIAGCSGSVDQAEHAALASFVGESHLKLALQEPHELSHFRMRLDEAISNRAQPLSALDVNRIFTCLIAVSQADGIAQKAEKDALHELAEHFGVAPAYVNNLLNNDT